MNNAQKTIVTTRVIALLIGMLTTSALLAGPVKVKVSESTFLSLPSYAYRVVNGTAQPITSLRIGFDAATGNSQLHSFPIGWTLRGGLSTYSALSPSGWTVRVVTTEESDLFFVSWSSDDGASFDIPPGATASGFEVILTQTAPEYRTARFDALLANGEHVFGAVEPDAGDDTTPPRLTVTLTPSVIWPPDKKMVLVTANITISDDTDPHPTVRLLSVLANEMIEEGDVKGAALGTDDRQFSVRAQRNPQSTAGRVYIATYSATDAAGNTTTTTATVIVPHDSRP